MEREKYITDSNETYTLFEFVSEGINGNIKKVVLYQHWGGNTYNLAFGDFSTKTERLNDTSRSNNGDKDKVLATVAHTVLTFLQHYPNANIFMQGNSEARTRLYQIQLALHINKISSQYLIEGYIEGVWEIFKRGKNYESFSIRNRKNSKFEY